jgi:hypothetical protein
MTVIAIVAVILAAPRPGRSPDGAVALIAALAILVVLSSVNKLAALTLCPACSRPSMRRLARSRHYYRCSACRGRFKRFGFGPWLDASGPEDAARYGRRSEAGIWKGYAAPREPGKSGSGRLLRGKRSRDLLDEVRQAPPRPDAGRRLEEAEKKVRKFLKSLYAVEE